MIEEVVFNYLSEKLDVPVMMEYPEVPSEEYPTLPESFVIIERVGGGVVNHVNAASLAIQTYAGSLYEAAALNETVRGVMLDMLELDEVGGVRLASYYNHTDTRTKQYRYQCIFDIYHV